MADELNLEVHAVFDKGGVRREIHVPLLQVDVAGARGNRTTQTLSTSEETLDLGEVGVGGYCVIVNRSSTTGEDVTVKVKTGETAGIEILPGEVAGPFRWNASAVPTVVSAAGTPTIDILLIEL